MKNHQMNILYKVALLSSLSLLHTNTNCFEKTMEQKSDVTLDKNQLSNLQHDNKSTYTLETMSKNEQ